MNRPRGAPTAPASAEPSTPDVARRFAAMPHQSPEEYNYEHFRTRHLVRDAKRTLEASGIRPGEEAPNFERPTVGGGSLRLSDLRGRPVLLRFGSVT